MSQRYPGGLINSNTNATNSVLFNGSSTYLSLTGASQYAIASSTTPFTIEFWIKPTAAGGVVFTEQYTGAGNTIPIVCALATTTAVETNAGLYPAFGWYNGSTWTTAAVSTTQLTLSVWSHIAFVFTGSTSKVYINGVDVTKASAPTPATTWGVTGVSGESWYISKRWDSSAGGSYITGNISNFRFVNGTAVYTANFTVPYILLPITNTVLLTCRTFPISDNSSYNAAIINVNSSTVVPDSPFTLTPPYNPALGAATPGVWTLSQANQAAAQRSWNMYDPFFNLNTAMVHGNGTNGGNNNTFLDSSTNNFSVTRNGNATQGTFTPFSKPNGYWGNYFDGTGDYLTVPSSTNLAFGTGNFTIECWVYFNSTTGTFVPFAQSDAIGTSTNNKWFFALGSNTLRLQTHSTGGFTCTTPFNPAVGTWYHVAAVRSSGTILLFIDGVSGTVTTTGTPSGYDLGQNGVAIGGMSTPYYLNGYISNFRLLKGTALYTTSFTPSTAPLTAVTNTQLLTCQSNRFADNSANNFTITPSGDARAITYSPFYPPTAYLPQNNGGAMFFDGAGDYLTVTGNSNLALGTGNFTIEFFIFLTTTTAFQFLYDATPSGASGAYPMIYMATGPVIIFATVDVDRIVSNSTIVRYQWNHVVVSRVSGTTRMFINGVQQTQTYTDSNNYINGTNRPLVGFGGQIAGNPFNGFISNLRVLKGTGVTSVTVPTAPLTPITNTQLLLSGTNASFIDNATNLTIETANTSISTAQSKYGGSSMVFNGTNAYARFITPYNLITNAVQPLGDFTVEGWVNPASLANNGCIFYVNGSSTSYATTRVDVAATTGVVYLLVSFNNAGWTINTATTQRLVVGTWTHIAVVRTGGTFILYFDGVAAITNASLSATTSLVNGEYTLIGALYNSGYGQFFNGYISDFRLTNYARYKGAFTPPTSTLQNQ